MFLLLSYVLLIPATLNADITFEIVVACLKESIILIICCVCAASTDFSVDSISEFPPTAYNSMFGHSSQFNARYLKHLVDPQN